MNMQDGSLERPDIEHYSDTPIFNTKAVVQQTGVPGPTLRAWERRYTFISPERAENDYRLYSERHIMLIRWLKERTDEGMSISQAIALYRYLSEEPLQQGSQRKNQQNSHAPDALIDSPPTFQVAVSPPAPQEEQTALQNDQATLREDANQTMMNHQAKLSSEDAQSAYQATHNMHIVQEKLIDTFQRFDESTANMLMGSMLAIYSLEQVCTELVAPTLRQIGYLWAKGELKVPVEHFASNFFRALLTNLFHVMASPRSGPLAIVCCAPGEPHELASLMLALFLRRRSMRVAYLGQSIDATGLLHIIKKLAPALVCISLTMPDYLPALISLGRQMQQLPPPRPIHAFGGQVFTHYANIIPQIPGIFMDGDLQEIADRLCYMIEEDSKNKN